MTCPDCGSSNLTKAGGCKPCIRAVSSRQRARRDIALDVFDAEHIFGRDPISRYSWARRFKPRVKRASAKRDFERFRARLEVHRVPHTTTWTVDPESADTERPCQAVILCPLSRAWALEVLDGPNRSS